MTSTGGGLAAPPQNRGEAGPGFAPPPSGALPPPDRPVAEKQSRRVARLPIAVYFYVQK